MLVFGRQAAHAFALLGPLPGYTGLPATFGDAWQTIELGYGLAYENASIPGSPVFLGDIGGPKNVGVTGTEDSIGEGYRRNDPVVYYGYDANFDGYFGPKGEAACDQAFAIMNQVFTNYPTGVDGYSSNLVEFPFDSQHFNGTAQALYLTDIKSVTLHLLVEQMGLAEPERYTWTLHDRFQGASPPPCPENISYLVVQRNYGSADQPLTGPETGTLYSPYVNDLLYTYGIAEDCGHHPPDWTAVAIPFSTDTTVPEYTAVAANDFEGGEENGLGGLQVGGYYTGLTEDDVAGLRYLMSSNAIAPEIPTAGSQLEATNSYLLPLETSPLYPLLQFAQTNPPSIVTNTYPGLVIDSYSNYYTFVTNWVTYSYFTNYPGSPASAPPVFVVGTNGYTLSWQTNYVYNFANMVIVDYYTNTPATLITVSAGAGNSGYGGPAGAQGSFTTNIFTQTVVLSNVISGDYFILPPNSCGFDIVETNAANVFAGVVTNFVTTATNTAASGSTNAIGFVGSQTLEVLLTNNFFSYYACTLQTNGPARYRGIEQVHFVRIANSDIDPYTDALYTYITNTYTMQWVTNFQHGSQTFQRVITTPDILFTATDDGQANTFNGTVTRGINFEVGQILPGLAGPGTIDGQTIFNFNKIGTAWWNGPFPDTNSFLDGPQSEVNQTTGIPSLLWASFDGTTNTPVVYPSSLSVQELESQMAINISPTNLPDATNGIPYAPVPFSATGGTAPYTWTVAKNSALPLGLYISQNYLEGTPNGNSNGVYGVTIQMTDSSVPANVVLTPYTINIH